jgi:hypothetical protein
VELPCVFTVTLTEEPQGPIEELIDAVEALQVPAGIKQALLDQLNRAQMAWDQGNEKVAFKELREFSKLVRQYRRMDVLTFDMAQELLRQARMVAKAWGMSDGDIATMGLFKVRFSSTTSK